MYMIHHYLQKGIKPEDVINLPLLEKLFYRASMDIYLEEEVEKINKLAGG